MKIITCALLSVVLYSLCGQSFAETDLVLSGKQLRPGCLLKMHKAYPPSVDPDVNANIFDLQILWQCPGAKVVQVGEIDAEGVGPEIVTVFYRPNQIVTLVRWTSAAAGADFEGSVYQVDAFGLEDSDGRPVFKRQPEITQAFGDGYDGVLNGKRVTFPYKNAAAIRSRLALLGL